MQETWVQSLGREDSLKESMATYSSILAEEHCGQRSLAGYGPWCHIESDMTEVTSTQGCMHCVLLLGRLGTWDPLLQCYNAYTWKNFSSNKILIQRDEKRLKITACRQLGEIIDNKIQKEQKSQLPLLRSWKQKECLGSFGSTHAPCTHHHQRGGQNT